MILSEIAVLVNSQLSSQQQEALLRLFMARGGDPSLAMQSLSGDAKLVAAAEYLLKAGLITAAGNGIVVSKTGEGELVTAGLLDANGPTDKARELLGQPSAKSSPDRSLSVSAGETVPAATK